MQIQKAMAILQFKVEAQLIDEYPSFDLEDRKQLHTIKFSSETDSFGNPTGGTVEVSGVEYESPTPCSLRWIGPTPTSLHPKKRRS